MKKILVPLDGSDFAETAIAHAETLAKAVNAEIVLLRVVAMPGAVWAPTNASVIAATFNDIIQEAHSYIKTEVEKVQEDGCHVKGIVERGAVPEAILSVAEETHADLITMATHGRTGIARWFLGSVADQIVHKSHVPVILIHPN